MSPRKTRAGAAVFDLRPCLTLALLTLLALVLGIGPARAAEAAKPVEVMVVGVFHLSNPGHDQYNVQVDDVLAPKRQAEIALVAQALGRFRPTIVAAEWPAETVAERYPKYLAGSLPPSRNEVVQLGFRLAKAADARMIGVDVDGDFPFDPVQAYAKAHGGAALLDAAGAEVQEHVTEQERRLASGGIGAVLRYINDPAVVQQDTGFYHSTLRVGGGAEQPGVDLLTAWYRRNFLICANLIQQARPGDRMVVFYGSGHAFLLRQCIAETPGFHLVEANAYLPG